MTTPAKITPTTTLSSMPSTAVASSASAAPTSVWGRNQAQGGLAQRLRAQQQQQDEQQQQQQPQQQPAAPRATLVPAWTPALPPHTSAHHHYHAYHGTDGTFVPPVRLTRDNSTVVVALLAWHARSRHVLLTVDEDQPNTWYLPTICVSVDLTSPPPYTIVSAVHSLVQPLRVSSTKTTISKGNDNADEDDEGSSALPPSLRYFSVEHFPTLRTSWLRFTVAITLDDGEDDDDGGGEPTAQELRRKYIRESSSSTFRFFPLDDVLANRVALSSGDIVRFLEQLKPLPPAATEAVSGGADDSEQSVATVADNDNEDISMSSVDNRTYAPPIIVAPPTLVPIVPAEHEFPYLLLSIALITPHSLVLVRHPVASPLAAPPAAATTSSSSSSSWWSLPVTHVDKGETLSFCANRFARALFGLNLDLVEHVSWVEESRERSRAQGPSLRYAGFRLTCLIDVSHAKCDPAFRGTLRAEPIDASQTSSDSSATTDNTTTTSDDPLAATLVSTVPHTIVSRAQLAALHERGELRDGLFECVARWWRASNAVRPADERTILPDAALLTVQPESSNAPPSDPAAAAAPSSSS